MTNLQALKANISSVHGVVLTENHFMKALIDQGLIAGAQYNNAAKIDFATIALYDAIIGGAGFSEGSLNYSVNIQGVKDAKLKLERKLGISDENNTIRSPKVW